MLLTNMRFFDINMLTARWLNQSFRIRLPNVAESKRKIYRKMNATRATYTNDRHIDNQILSFVFTPPELEPGLTHNASGLLTVKCELPCHQPLPFFNDGLKANP